MNGKAIYICNFSVVNHNRYYKRETPQGVCMFT